MDSTYAPQSPDLSSFLSPPAPQPLPAPSQTHHQSTSYAPRSPEIPSFGAASSLHQHHSHHASLQNSLDGARDARYFVSHPSASYMPPFPDLPASHSFAASSNQLPLWQHDHPPLPTYLPLETEGPNPYAPLNSNISPQQAMPGPGSRRQNLGGGAGGMAMPLQASQYKNPNPNNIEIKTKFPVARIKRIMQADEEVGKVAQVTPVAVSKALELFMIALVEGAAEKAKEKGGKRVTAQHLKAVVEGSPEQFDFLNEIVARIQEAPEGEGKRKKVVDKDSDSSEEEQKRPKKGKGRRKKSDD